ncbi:alpha/beta hydrolase [Streptomyces scabichelini]|uniref:alpha/beta fold hydrolase n=1 Tax=Streptomyces scabichelini TaxID=2711217 RepID=UPI0030B9B2D7
MRDTHRRGQVADRKQHLGIEKWLVLGGSWGVTLALAYAEQHPGRVSELVLFSVTNTTRREVEWVTRDMGRVFPEEWARFCDAVPERERDGSLVEAYARMLADADPAVRERAAREWCRWEDVHVSTHQGYKPDPCYEHPHFRLRFARLVTHYWRHAGFLEDGVLLRDAGKLAGIPGVMVHGRMRTGTGCLGTPRRRPCWRPRIGSRRSRNGRPTVAWDIDSARGE